jgi:hypothetical protein
LTTPEQTITRLAAKPRPNPWGRTGLSTGKKVRLGFLTVVTTTSPHPGFLGNTDKATTLNKKGKMVVNDFD